MWIFRQKCCLKIQNFFYYHPKIQNTFSGDNTKLHFQVNNNTKLYFWVCIIFNPKIQFCFITRKYKFVLIIQAASLTAPNSPPCSVFSLKARTVPYKAHYRFPLEFYTANRTVLKSVPFLVPYRNEPNIINLSVFTTKKTVNGPYLGTVRFAKMENAFFL